MTDNLLPLLLISGTKTWKMPQLPGLNKLPPRATLHPFPSGEAALTLDRTTSPWFLPLDGTWDFKILPRPEDATGKVLRSGGWKPIQVPGNWTMQGFGSPQ